MLALRLRLRAAAFAAAFIVGGVAAPACTAANDGPATSDCERVRAHLVDLQISRESRPGDAKRTAELAKHRRIRLGANKTAALARCRSHMSEADIACALGAASLDDYRACGRK